MIGCLIRWNDLFGEIGVVVVGIILWDRISWNEVKCFSAFFLLCDWWLELVLSGMKWFFGAEFPVIDRIGLQMGSKALFSLENALIFKKSFLQIFIW